MTLREIQAGEGGALGALARAGLFVLSLPFGAAARLRRWLYDRGIRSAHRIGVPVVCVGNLTAGGTGKTPLVAWLAMRALAAGRHPAIVSRGYGPPPLGASLSDEGALLRELMPADIAVVEDPDRVRGAAAAIRLVPDCDLVLLDDGFSHRRLARDADLVLLDATNPFGFDRLLPRGLLREPATSLRRATAVVVTRVDRVPDAAVAAIRDRLAALAPRASVALAKTRPRSLLRPSGGILPLESLRGAAVFAWSGIGNPAQFEATLVALSARVVGALRARDHFQPTPADVARAADAARAAGASLLVVTRKDLVKLRALPSLPDTLVALDVEIEFAHGADALLALALSAGRG